MSQELQPGQQYAVRSEGPVVSIIEIDGELNASSSGKLSEAYARAATTGVTTIVLSFRDLRYMNSSGIGLIVTLLIRAKRNGQRVFAAELSEHYRQIFSLTRLDEAIQIFDSEADAISAAAA